MTRALDVLFESGASRAVLVGSDSPTLPPAYISDSFQQLEGSDVVLGPTSDGGYYLIGVRARPGRLLENIRWSTPQAIEDTEARARIAGLSVARLRPWYDIDTCEDLIRLRMELEEEILPGRAGARATREAMSVLAESVDSFNHL
jgi:glycosyltransferase A (GT-A) superfamily protein (DUF2064 family)